MPDFDYDSIDGGFYDRIMYERGAVRRVWHRMEFDTIESLMPTDSNSRILDVGCAAGSFIGLFQKSYGTAKGIDLGQAQISYANKKYANEKNSFVAGDIRSMVLEKDYYDFVVMSELIEHISYAESLEVLKKLRETLKPSGILILSTPNYRSLWPLLELALNRLSRLSQVNYEHQHVNKLHMKTCLELLSKAGFKAKERKTIMIAAPFLAALSEKLAYSVLSLEQKILPYFGYLMVVSAGKA